MGTAVKKIGQFLVITLGFGIMGAVAEEAPPPPAIVDAYFCTYQPGKDRGDLLATRDNFVKVAAREDVALNDAYVWHASKGASPADFIWMSVHENLAAYGAATQAIADSEAVSAAVARFDTVAKCQSNLGSARTVREGKPLPEGEGTFIVSNMCKTKGPMSIGDIQDFRGHIGDVMDGMKSFEQVTVYSIVPMTGGPESPDVVLFGVHDSVGGWASRSAEMAASPAGQSLQRHAEAILECSTSMWNSEQVISP